MSSAVKQTAVSASNQDLQATQQIIRLFEVAKNEAEESIDRLPGIFLVVNRRGFILRANDYYAEMLKTTVEDALFANLKDIFAEEVWSVFLVNLRELEDTVSKTGDLSKSLAFEMPIRAANGFTAVYLWQIKVFSSSTTGEKLFYVFGQDVTELRVKEKQLLEIFESIPVGIVTCNSKGLIEPHYSKFCEVLFGEGQIAGMPVFQRVFTPALKFMKDVEAKGAYALVDCLDQPMDVYELLAMAFPKQIFYPNIGSDTEGKFIAVSYQPIVLSAKVDRILIMFTDRTAIQKAQNETDAKAKQEEVHVRRILEVKSCIAEVIPITMSEMDELLPQIAEQFPNGLWKESLNPLHSVKGNARLSGLKTIAEMVHELEGLVLKIVANPDDVERIGKAKELFEKIQNEWKEFRDLFRMMAGELGISAELENRTSIDLEIVQDLFNRYNDLLYSADKVGAAVLRERIQLALESANHTSIDFIKPLANARAKEVAEAYDKKVNVVFQGSSFKIPTDAKSIVNECIVHLVSNAVAHGVESPEVRVGMGKPAAGTITIKYWDEMGFTHIEVGDDGKGIDVERVRQSASKKGVLSLEESLNKKPEEIVNLIFAPGFSTAEKVDEIAGRGVGLSAIKENVENHSGSVRVVSDGLGKGTKFILNFDTVRNKLSKRLVSQLDFLQILKDNLGAMTNRNHVKADLHIHPDLVKRESLVFCDVGKMSLALLTLIGTTSGGTDVDVRISNAGDKLIARIEPKDMGTANATNYFSQFPEYELSKRSCERFISHHQGEILEISKGIEVRFGYVVDSSRIPVINCFLQGNPPDPLSLELYAKIEKWAAGLNVKVQKIDSILDASFVIGKDAGDLGQGAISNDEPWANVRQRFIEAVEKSLGINRT